jgi:hypothetical protein
MSVGKKSIPIISILLLWIAYTVVYTVQLNDALAAFLEFLPGVLGIVILLVSGFNNRVLYLHKAPISRRGALFLSVLTPIEVSLREQSEKGGDKKYDRGLHNRTARNPSNDL